MTSLEKKKFRADIFRHLDGIVICPLADSLLKQGVCAQILEHKKTSLSELTAAFKANKGYLNVALRALSSQGWLDYKITEEDVLISANDSTALAFKYFHLYDDVVNLMKLSEQYHPRKFQEVPFKKMQAIIQQFKDGYGIKSDIEPQEKAIVSQISKHIEGVLVGPTTVILGMGGMFQQYFMSTKFKAEEYHSDPDNFNKLLSFLAFLGWFTKTDDTFEFTNKGVFFAKRASAYGVTVSYIPMLRHADHLMFGNLENRNLHDKFSAEMHVDRKMNVWGSGGAHGAYFSHIDELVIKLFNRPIEEQPKGILDMGCGNGAFLIHLFDIIEKKTLRGQMLEEHPLMLIGADYNKEALQKSRENLIKADVWAKLIWGDIGDPDLLANDLKATYDVNLVDLLNVRTFLDHNRIWEERNGAEKQIAFSNKSTGAFASKGKYLSGNEVANNLFQHFKKWKPYIEKFGLIFIELHTINPSLTSKNIGLTAATAYDVTHGFSDQYILEIDVLHEVLERLGLYNDTAFFRKFPNRETATVSLNYISKK